MSGDRQWVAGGELGSTDKSAQHLKKIILDILQEGETVTKALKRLKPVSKKATGKRKTRSTAKQADVADDDDAEVQTEKDNKFSQLTDAAGELMNLGFENIYQDTKQKIADGLDETAEGNANRGGVVWHDDGSVKDDAAKKHKMYQRDTADTALTFQESAEAAKDVGTSPAEPAQPQIPVPSAAAIPEADQQSLAAAQQAADSGPTPATDPEVNAAGAPSDSDAQTVQEASNSAAGVSSQPATAALNGAEAPAEPSNAVLSTAAANNASLQGNQAASLSGVEVPLPEKQAPGTSSADAQQLPEANDPSATPASPSKASNVTNVPANELQSKTPDTTADVADAAGSGPMDTETGSAVQPDTATDPVRTEDASAASVSTASAGDSGTEATAGAASAGTAEPATSDAPVTQAAAAAARSTANGSTSWKGTGKGPGLGQSQEFSGGPVNFARPKYRHAPYNLPPARGGGRFGGGNTWSPRGRAPPRGMSSPAGRGFSDPLRSSTMRPQYQQQPPPPTGRPRFGQPPPFVYPPQPPPPAYYPPPQQQFQQQYQPPYPPPQQPFVQQAQYAQPPYTPPPPYGGQSAYPAPPPAQPPPYDAQWQNQQAQGQYTGYQQPAVFPGAPPA